MALPNDPAKRVEAVKAVNESLGYWTGPADEGVLKSRLEEAYIHLYLTHNTEWFKATGDLEIGRLVMERRLIDAIDRFDRASSRLARIAIRVSVVSVVISAVSVAIAILGMVGK